MILVNELTVVPRPMLRCGVSSTSARGLMLAFHLMSAYTVTNGAGTKNRLAINAILRRREFDAMGVGVVVLSAMLCLSTKNSRSRTQGAGPKSGRRRA